ncbi:MAG: XdhC family protein [Verrucomicrobiota bacterium]
MKDLNRILHHAVTQRNQPWCLATLVKAEGSSYRQPGARLLVHADGRHTTGYISAGCLEEEIARQGGEVLDCGIPRLVNFDTRVLFGCDGRLSVYLERIPPAGVEGNFLTTMAARIGIRAHCRVAVPYAAAGASELVPDTILPGPCDGTFLQTLPPPRRMIVFGSGPEVAPLKSFAAVLGWVFEAYAHPDELAEEFSGDAATAAVVMTHKIGRDLSALHRLVPLGLPYIGLLGAKSRHRELLSLFVDLHGMDLPRNWTHNIHAPAGLDIGSESPEEIAFSILGEAASVLAGRSGGFLKEKQGSIHGMEAAA